MNALIQLKSDFTHDFYSNIVLQPIISIIFFFFEFHLLLKPVKIVDHIGHIDNEEKEITKFIRENDKFGTGKNEKKLLSLNYVNTTDICRDFGFFYMVMYMVSNS